MTNDQHGGSAVHAVHAEHAHHVDHAEHRAHEGHGHGGHADHADHAVLAAVQMVEELRRMNDEWVAAGRPALDIGVGINSGDMVAGNIGSWPDNGQQLLGYWIGR